MTTAATTATTQRLCSAEGCEGAHRARGWCSMHYQRWQIHGTAEPSRTQRQRLCSVEGCERATRARGWCNAHYTRWRNHGTTDLPERAERAERACEIAGCEKARLYATGLCGMHYARKHRTGSTERTRPERAGRACEIAGCEKALYATGLCGMHYARKRRTGSTERTRPVGRRQAQRPHLPAGWDVRMEMAGWRCWLCGIDVSGDNANGDRRCWVDHVKPRKAAMSAADPKGKSVNILANLRPSCAPCNQSKRAAWPVDTSTRAMRKDPARLP